MISAKSDSAETFSLSVTIEKFEGKVAQLKTQDNQIINWPIKELPDEAKIGSKVRLVLRTSDNEQIEREKVAKTILNEILKTDKGQG